MRAGYGNKASVARALRVLRKIEEGGYPNCQKMAEEYEVSAKSIQRDIDFLRDEWGMPLEYDAARFGYALTGPIPDLPLGKLSEGELLALFLAGEVAGALRGTRMGELLERAVKRISLFANERYDVGMREMREALCVIKGAEMKVAAEVFAGLEEGVKKRKVVEFLYRKPGAMKDERRRVQVWQMFHVAGGWYVVGWDEGKEAERTFALGRVKGVEVLRERFVRPKEFDACLFLKGSFGVFGGGEQGREYKVVLRFNAWAATHIREREWHASEVKREVGEGELELTMRLTSLEEVERWVMSWGANVEVLRPATLRKKLAVTGRVLAERYGE